MFYEWYAFDLCKWCSIYAGEHVDSFTICNPGIQYLRKNGPLGRKLMRAAVTFAKLSDQHKVLSAYQAYVDEGVRLYVYLQSGFMKKTEIEHGKFVKDEERRGPYAVHRFSVCFSNA
jgi:hypothetical protein